MIKINPTMLSLLHFIASTTSIALFSDAHLNAQEVIEYYADPTWPKNLPNNWKFGGITGLSIDDNDNVWVLNRPNDLSDLELLAEHTQPVAQCCARPPSMIHFDKRGNVIGFFDAPQGHGMDVDSDGYVYIGQDTVRKYDTQTGAIVAELERTPERENGARVGLPPPAEFVPGKGTLEHAAVFMPETPEEPDKIAAQAAAAAIFREKYPPETPMLSLIHI